MLYLCSTKQKNNNSALANHGKSQIMNSYKLYEVSFEKPIDVKFVCNDWLGVSHIHYFIYLSACELVDSYNTLSVFGFKDIKIYFRPALSHNEYDVIDY